MNAMGIKRYRQLRAIIKNLSAGVSITQACKAAQIDPATLWRWRKSNPRLDSFVYNIVDSRIQLVEDATFKKALDGSVAAQVFFLCNRSPDKWHNVADVKNILIAQMNSKKEDDISPDRFKEVPRVVFSAIKKEEHV